MNDINTLTSYKKAEQLMLDALDIVEDTGDHADLAKKFVSAIYLGSFKEFMITLPSDIIAKIKSVFTTNIDENFLKEVGEFMPLEQRKQIFDETLRKGFDMYRQEIEPLISDEQKQKLAELAATI